MAGKAAEPQLQEQEASHTPRTLGTLEADRRIHPDVGAGIHTNLKAPSQWLISACQAPTTPTINTAKDQVFKHISLWGAFRIQP